MRSVSKKYHKSLAFLVMLLTSVSLYAQSGEIKGKVLDTNKEPVLGAFVSVAQGGVTVFAVYTGIDGSYSIGGLNPGKYSVTASSSGYQDQSYKDVNLGTNQKIEINFSLNSSVENIDVVEVIVYKKPLVDKDKQATIVTAKEIQDLAVRNVKDIVATTGDVISKDDGSGDLNIRGQRSSGTVFFVDGIRFNDDISIPQTMIEQVEVITGGVPAKYGDNSGGIVLVTTKGTSSKYFGGAELVSSQYLDGYGFNLFNGVIGGPIIKPVVDSNGVIVKKSPLGFILGAEVSYIKDPRPSSTGGIKIKDDVLNDLITNPLRAGANGSGTLLNAEFINPSDIERTTANNNVESFSASLNGKIDYQLNKRISLTIGGNAQVLSNNQMIFPNLLFNAGSNRRQQQGNFSGFIRYKQRFGGDTISNALISKGYFQIQFSYTNFNSIFDNDKFGDKFFDYGFLGTFSTTREPTYKWEEDGPNGDAYYFKGEKSSAYEIVDLNELNALSNYARQYYEIFDGKVEGNYSTWQEVQSGGALLNGDNPPFVYALWYSPGYEFGYARSNTAMYDLSGSMAATVAKKHNVEVGFEFRKQEARSYFLATPSLWGLMRQYSNSKNTQLDLDNPILVTANGVFLDTVKYNYAYDPTVENGDTVKGFFENVRDKFGVAYNQFFDPDEHGPSNYSLGLFNADELYNNSTNVLSTYGYDYQGNRLSDGTLQDFFTHKDENGAFTRKVAPFEPIYAAGYIQDKFEFKDIVFNLGLRVDRYDANQMVLKDKYSLYEIRTAGSLGSGYTKPDNIGDDYKVYVNDNSAATPTVVGYRNGDTWYNSKGEEITNGNELAESSSSGAITPYFTDPEQSVKKSTFDVSKSFEAYKPRYNFMPRVNLTFNMSENSSFFAHYDILTQRPINNNIRPTDYLFWDQTVGGIQSNPNLSPTSTIDYEVGFQQAISKKSAVTISGYYRDIRDLVNVVQIQNAYPRNYTTFDNVDFGTVKGLSMRYDLRAINTNFSLNAFYTLQFAEGTGSSTQSNVNLVNNGFPTLKTVSPLDFDQRHSIKLIFNYGYKDGKDYNGPSWNGWGKKILSNTGVNLFMKAYSGTPYTRQANFTQSVAIGLADKSITEGSINGSRLPWSYSMDLRASKRIFYFGKGGEKATPVTFEIYLAVLNLLNNRNLVSVYRATGNPEDDGFLNAASSQSIIQAQNDAVTFQELYRLRVNSPFNYTLPRQIRLGLAVDF